MFSANKLFLNTLLLTATNLAKSLNLYLSKILAEVRRNLYRELGCVEARSLFFLAFFFLRIEDSICSLVWFSKAYISDALKCRAVLRGSKRECASKDMHQEHLNKT